MEVKGTITKIFDKEQVSDSFVKRGVVVTTEGRYPQPIFIEFTQDNVDKPNNFKVGDKVEVGINLRGREWTNNKGEVKYFNTLQGWSITGVVTSNSKQQPDREPQLVTEEDDDLPF